MFILKWTVLIGLAVVVGLSAYIRLAPVDQAALKKMPQGLVLGDKTGAGDFVSLRSITAPPEDVLAALDTLILATPRTQKLDEGIYQTRSLVMGFPDYTTVRMIESDNGQPQLMIYSRLRYGGSDLGVNAARAQGWLDALGPLTVAP